MLTRIVVAAAIALTAHGGAFAQESFDFGQIPGVPSDPNVQVDLNSALIAFAAEAAKGSDPSIGDVLNGIEGIHVRVYKELTDTVALTGFIDDKSKTLERAGWQRMVYVRDGGDKVRVYVKMKDKLMTGMTVMVIDESEAVFINIAGSIDPAQLGRVARMVGAGDVLGGFASDGSGPRERRWRAPNDVAGESDDDR
jgi:hypothetical protein